MVATSSIKPGVANMVTGQSPPGAATDGGTFAGRIPDPALRQVEHFSDP